MQKILARQLFFIPVLYAVSKYLWNLIPVHNLPDLLETVVSDFFGPVIIMALFISTFIYLLWKIPILDKISQFLLGTKPFIQGTWCGKINYEYDKKKLEKTAFLVIMQTNGYSLHIQLLTDERESFSYFSDIVPSCGMQQIIYTYSNKEDPVNKIKNPSHKGFCQLDIDTNHKALRGIYYTSRKTFGKMQFNKKSKKIINNYENAKKLFGV